MKLLPIVLLLAISAATALCAAERTWTDVSGRYTIKAELVSVQGGSVTLKRENGKFVTLPLQKLSEKDRRYVASLGKKEGANEKEEAPKEAAPKNKTHADDELAVDYLKKLKARFTLDGEGRVETVDLQNTKVRDGDLAYLRGLTKLTSLDLTGCRVTRAGLGHLIGLTNLRDIKVAKTKLGPQDIQALQSAALFGVTVRDSMTTRQGKLFYDTKIVSLLFKDIARKNGGFSGGQITISGTTLGQGQGSTGVGNERITTKHTYKDGLLVMTFKQSSTVHTITISNNGTKLVFDGQPPFSLLDGKKQIVIGADGKARLAKEMKGKKKRK